MSSIEDAGKLPSTEAEEGVVDMKRMVELHVLATSFLAAMTRNLRPAAGIAHRGVLAQLVAEKERESCPSWRKSRPNPRMLCDDFLFGLRTCLGTGVGLAQRVWS
jgi:hypothetical protein